MKKQRINNLISVLKDRTFLKVYGLSVVISFLITFSLMPLTGWIHEPGHMLFGYIGSILHGQTASFYISAWQDLGFIPLKIAPQQTTSIQGVLTGGFYLGGILLTLLVIWVIVYFVHKYTKLNKMGIMFIALGFTTHQIVGNLVCGTDNWVGDSLPICLPIVREIYPFVVFLFLLFGFHMLILEKVLKGRRFRQGVRDRPAVQEEAP